MRRHAILLFLTSALAAGTASALPAVAQTTGELVSRTELRVCADPSNLPFSNDKEEGFENKIALLLGADLKLPVKTTWFPQVMGFLRNTLAAHRCDLVMGTVAGDPLMQTSSPYYYTSYVLLYRTDRNYDMTSVDEVKMKGLKIGVVAGTPPADLLVRHNLMAQAKPYALMVDTRVESPTHEMVKDIAGGQIDVGLLWGPIAGYYVRHDKLPITIVPLKNEPGAPRLDYHIAMGMRAGEPEWRHTINAAIAKEHDAIVAVLKDYGVPLLDEQGNLMQ